MEQTVETAVRPNCTALVRHGPRAGLPCSVYAGSGNFKEFCFHHTQVGLEEEEECSICLETKKISWIGSCRCKTFFCKECLADYQNAIRSITNCPVCRDPMNDVWILRPPPPLPPQVVRDFTFIMFGDVPCSVSELPEEQQGRYFKPWGQLYIPFMKTDTDISIIKPALDALRKRRIAKIKEQLGDDATIEQIVEKYEEYMQVETWEDYDNHRRSEDDDYSGRKFPHNVTTVYWAHFVGKKYKSYLMFFESNAYDFTFCATNSKTGWIFSLWRVDFPVEELNCLRESRPSWYKQYRIDTREYWAKKRYQVNHIDHDSD